MWIYFSVTKWGGGKVKGVNDLKVPLMTYNSLNGNSLSIKISQDGRL